MVDYILLQRAQKQSSARIAIANVTYRSRLRRSRYRLRSSRPLSATGQKLHFVSVHTNPSASLDDPGTVGVLTKCACNVGSRAERCVLPAQYAGRCVPVHVSRRVGTVIM
eukprot:Opistho-2@67195